MLDLNFMLPCHFRYAARKSSELAGFKELSNLILMVCRPRPMPHWYPQREADQTDLNLLNWLPHHPEREDKTGSHWGRLDLQGFNYVGERRTNRRRTVRANPSTRCGVADFLIELHARKDWQSSTILFSLTLILRHPRLGQQGA